MAVLYRIEWILELDLECVL